LLCQLSFGVGTSYFNTAYVILMIGFELVATPLNMASG